MTWLFALAAAVVCVALSALFSGAETGIYCANRLRLRLDGDRGDVRARRLLTLLENEQQALATILVGTNVANYLTTVAAAWLLNSRPALSGREVELYTTLAVTPVLFVFGEVVPKNLFQRAPDHLLYVSSFALSVARALLYPVVWATRRLSSLVVRVLSFEGSRRQALERRERVAGLLSEALADWKHQHHPGQFVEGVVGLSDTPVRAVMVPATDVVALSAAASRASFTELIRGSSHTRFPVYDSDSRRAVGVVHAHALLSDPDWESVGQKVEQTVRLRLDTSVASAIVQVRRSGVRMALVDDADGRLAGIVTLTDLFEEIVGDLAGG
jgi:CBS domain containing-hemolysin-like protein